MNPNYGAVVMPAQAGIQRDFLDSRFRGSDAALERTFWQDWWTQYITNS
jgi:hypothetical protein